MMLEYGYKLIKNRYKLGPIIIPSMVERLRDKNREIRINGINFICELFYEYPLLFTKDDIEILKSRIRDKDEEVQRDCVRKLSSIYREKICPCFKTDCIMKLDVLLIIFQDEKNQYKWIPSSIIQLYYAINIESKYEVIRSIQEQLIPTINDSKCNIYFILVRSNALIGLYVNLDEKEKTAFDMILSDKIKYRNILREVVDRKLNNNVDV